MTELFETGRRILAHGRRLLVAPTLVGMPTAYASLVRDPSELLAETWGGAAHAGSVPEEAIDSAAPFKQQDGRTRLAPTGGGMTPFESISVATPSSLLNASPQIAQSSAGVSKAVPLSPPESRPRVGPTSATGLLPKDEGYAASSSRHPTAAGRLPRELPPVGEAHEEGLESYRPSSASRSSAAKVVEWPATRPAPVVGAALATPGNVRQEMEEEWGGDAELQRLRGQLEVEEGKRERLRPGAARETGARVPYAAQAEGDPTGAPAAQTPTSFSPLTSLLSKNVARGEETAADLAPQAPEVVSGGDVPRARGRGDEDEGRAGVERTDADGEGRRATAPLVEEVLEELYERLRLEFARSYGTNGG